MSARPATQHRAPPARPAEIPLRALGARIQDELRCLAVLAAEVQVAIGPVLDANQPISSAMIRKLQAIDRLQQTLDDLQRVLGIIAAHAGDTGIKTGRLDQEIRLRHLAQKLLDDPAMPFAHPDGDGGHISWF